jgi:hypothetical protein
MIIVTLSRTGCSKSDINCTTGVVFWAFFPLLSLTCCTARIKVVDKRTKDPVVPIENGDDAEDAATLPSDTRRGTGKVPQPLRDIPAPSDDDETFVKPTKLSRPAGGDKQKADTARLRRNEPVSKPKPAPPSTLSKTTDEETPSDSSARKEPPAKKPPPTRPAAKKPAPVVDDDPENSRRRDAVREVRSSMLISI